MRVITQQRCAERAGLPQAFFTGEHNFSPEDNLALSNAHAGMDSKVLESAYDKVVQEWQYLVEIEECGCHLMMPESAMEATESSA